MHDSARGFLGVSFDGLAISGIVNEFLNVASVFRPVGYRILFDVGEDITPRSDLVVDTSVIPHWAECIRLAGTPLPEGYGAQLVQESADAVAQGTRVTAVDAYAAICHELAAGIVATLERESVRILVVENGTLPDNPLYTEALYIAISEYGARHALGKYVLWRDHDLMWSTEPHLYGPYPYPGVRRPTEHAHIHYAVATDWMRQRFERWTGIRCHVIPNRFCAPDTQASSTSLRPSLRSAYGIPDDALLIARCTRIIPPKSIERDLLLIQALQHRLAAMDDHRRIFLFVTTPTDEDPVEFRRLREVADSLGLSAQIVWGNGLLSMNSTYAESADSATQYSVSDLLAEADLSSFLTTYDYEGFGNPPGEAMAMGVPYIVTSYELYQDVYGGKGAIAPVLSIKRDTPADEPVSDYFVQWVLRLLTDREYRDLVIKRNNDLCRRFFSLDALAEQLHALFG
jgi:glycosyltransferase involved in cell wall biosynthesis